MIHDAVYVTNATGMIGCVIVLLPVENQIDCSVKSCSFQVDVRLLIVFVVIFDI
jgi:hypothetical protein